MQNLFSKLQDFFFNKEKYHKLDDLSRIRSQVVLVSILLVIFIIPVYMVRNFFIDYYKMMPAHSALIALMGVCLWALKYYGKYEIPFRFLGFLLLLNNFIVMSKSHDLTRCVPWWGIYPAGIIFILKNRYESILWIIIAYASFHFSIKFDERDVFFNIHTTLIAVMFAYSTIAFINSYVYNRVFQKLEKTLLENKKKQDQLIEMAHVAGQADIAANTLSNVGNSLNSITILTKSIGDTQKNSSLTGLTQAGALLRENKDNIEDYILNDPEGKKIMDYFLQLEKDYEKEHENNVSQLERIQEKLENISEAIKGQGKYLHKETFTQSINITENIKEVLTMIEDKLGEHKINIITHFEEIPDIRIQKTKLVNIITNIIDNACDAMKETPDTSRDLHILVYQINNEIFIKIKDSGCGIPPNLMQEIFFHGFSTKENADGFGLHTCANYMTEMNGTISAESDGPGKGAAFILKFPT